MSCWCVLVMVVGLLFCWWDVPDWFEKPAVVEPVDVFEGGVLDVVEVPPWSLVADQFSLVEADYRLGQGIIVAVPDRSDRW